ncbi:hypothetical protein DL89DRAFT_51212 [Linderina pennispora]|uniref:Uncharacterized protein n=1 Tax=Linderina pennispora TaxID=61395 RepID=A0A1Y1W0K2_9FUNG|nr:uncharacterized protein DL89DRAFT_51212 [Linderina pennispora]ORX67039.1 hypothetical protein DL89DRAFT_51212 [Linderina pennispora]
MQDSIAQLHVDTTNLSGASNDGDMAGSPFLRKAIPNPFKSADSTMRSVSQSDSDAPAQPAGMLRPASSKKVAASPKALSKPQSSAIAADGEKRSLHSLEEAFKGLVIDSHPDTPQQISYYSPNMTSLPAGHIRDAAPGLDSERERPLPMPMSIPRSSSSTTRGPSRPQRTRPDDVFEAVPPGWCARQVAAHGQHGAVQPRRSTSSHTAAAHTDFRRAARHDAPSGADADTPAYEPHADCAPEPEPEPRLAAQRLYGRHAAARGTAGHGRFGQSVAAVDTQHAVSRRLQDHAGKQPAGGPAGWPVS